MRKFSIEADKKRVENLHKYENAVRNRGYRLIAGVDEAGRGSLVGSVVVAAVILPENIYLERLDDSKKLSANVREILCAEIMDKAISYAWIEVGVDEIDELNIYQATLEGMKRAVQKLAPKPDYVLTDAMHVDDFGDNIQTQPIIHGDSLSASIAAASIIAKVTRDRLANDWAKKFPNYGFEHNRGYGTKFHRDAIKKHGACEIHRKSFNPVKSMLSSGLTSP